MIMKGAQKVGRYLLFLDISTTSLNDNKIIFNLLVLWIKKVQYFFNKVMMSELSLKMSNLKQQK